MTTAAVSPIMAMCSKLNPAHYESRQVMRRHAIKLLKQADSQHRKDLRSAAGAALEKRQGAETGIRKSAVRAVTKFSRVTITMTESKQKRRASWADPLV